MNHTHIEQLDQQISALLLDATANNAESDATLKEMLEIAGELRDLPHQDFKAALRAELEAAEAARAVAAAAPEFAAEHVLPSLFGQGFNAYTVRRGNFALSLAAHAAVVLLMLTSGMWLVSHKGEVQEHVSMIAPTLLQYLPLSSPQPSSSGGGGGGDKSKLAATEGKLPRFADRQFFTPPTVVVNNEHPALPEEPTIVAQNIHVNSALPDLGDPKSTIVGPPSNGIGSASGIGSGTGGGIGAGNGIGIGAGFGANYGGGVYAVGGGVSAPRAIYAPDPEYSDEARKAKYQGVSTLELIVGPDGKPRNIHIAHALGMGLDQKAIEAVSNWKFAPALKDGRPVAVRINVEVAFRLF